MARTNSRSFMEKNFPQLRRYKCVASRMYESKEKKGYLDDWWFKFFDYDLRDNEYIVFVGAKDYINAAFQVFKVPTSFLLGNLNKLDMTDKGWINIHLHMKSHTDLRKKPGLSFKEFAVAN